MENLTNTIAANTCTTANTTTAKIIGFFNRISTKQLRGTKTLFNFLKKNKKRNGKNIAITYIAETDQIRIEFNQNQFVTFTVTDNKLYFTGGNGFIKEITKKFDLAYRNLYEYNNYYTIDTVQISLRQFRLILNLLFQGIEAGK